MVRKLIHVAALLLLTFVNTASAEIFASGGIWHSLINDNGVLYASGSNSHGALGLPQDTVESFDEIEVSLPVQVKKAEASHARSIALTKHGEVYLFGLGQNFTPQLINGFSNVTDVAVNDNAGFVLVDGEVYQGWSTNISGWTKVSGLENVISISARGKHLLAVDVNQAAYAFGDNTYGQLGLGDTLNRNDSASYINAIPQVKKAIAGIYHSMFIDIDDQLWAVGQGHQGKLGLGDEEKVTLPHLVPEGNDAFDVDGGKMQTILVKNDGTVWVTGWHNYIGENSYNRSSSLIQVAELEGIVDVAAGYDFLMASTATKLFSWGGNLYGKLALGDNTERHAPELARVSELVDSPSTCPTPRGTLDHLHSLKESLFLERLQFSQLNKHDKKAVRKEHKANTKLILKEINKLRSELAQLRNDGCPPHRHKYWRDNGMEYNRFQFNHKRRKFVLAAAREEAKRLDDHDHGHGNNSDKVDHDNPGKKYKK